MKENLYKKYKSEFDRWLSVMAHKLQPINLGVEWRMRVNHDYCCDENCTAKKGKNNETV